MPVIAIGILGGAVLALIILLSLPVFQQVVSHLIPSVPLIGGAIRSGVMGLVGALARALNTLLDDALVPLGFLVQGVALSIWWVCSAVANGVYHAVFVGRWVQGYAQQLYNQAIAFANGVYTSAFNHANALYNATYSRATTLYNQANAHTDWLNTGLYHIALNWYNAAIGHANAVGAAQQAHADYLNAGLNQLRIDDWNALQARITSVENSLQGQVTSLDHTVTAGLGAASTTAAADLAQAIKDADAAASAAETAAENYAQQILSTVSGNAVGALNTQASDVVNPALATLSPALGTIAHALPADVVQALGLDSVVNTKDVAGVAAALGVLAPAIAATATEVAECAVPMCSNLGGLSNLFGDLTDAALLGLILAMLVEAVHSPEQMVADADALGGYANSVASGFRSLVGI